MNNPYLPKKVKIIKIMNETDDTKTFRVSFKIDHDPGQFVNVSVLGIGEAPISFSSHSNKFVDLCIRNVGNVTNAIHKKKIGDYLWIRGPYGKGYPMKKFHNKDIILVGGGTGVAPLIGAVDYIEQNLNKFDNVKLFFGFRHDKAILFKRNFKKWGKLFDFDFTLDCKSKELKCNTGVITKLIEKADIKSNTIAIVCGPPIMIKFAVKSLLTKGIKEENIYISFERLMSCGIGKCGHCEVGGKYVCKNGPVFSYDIAKNMTD
ncbi:anaerobic sulfite reductase subunit AsrB [Candidatus Woesearchaeota archaeon]|jgi:anaerobic sulfite reductase subunit B|nr:anaerobic sulfite reductase subunit AsrB [Candidatus Woesearchaeota archaeon]